MMPRIQLLEPEISDKAIDDRGAIFSFVPHSAIVEFCYIDTKRGAKRGHHFHEEFDEYILLVQGEGIYLERLSNGSDRKLCLGAGQTIFIPRMTPHTFIPLTDCKSVSLLTRQWNHCKHPITPYT